MRLVERRFPVAMTSTAPKVAVRECGLPVSAIESLCCTDSFALIRRQVRETAWLKGEGKRLAVDLGLLIGERGDGDDGLRPVLVGLRRALHTGRLPDAREWTPRVASALPAELAARVADWVTRMRALTRARRELPELFAAEARVKEKVLAQVAADPGFRRALSLASPELAADLDRWLAEPARRPKTQKLLRPAKYVARAAVKTSPYSTFTSMGVAVWENGEDWADGAIVRFAPREPPSVILEPSGEWLHGALRAWLARPENLVRSRLRLNPSLVIRADKAEFLGFPPREPIIRMGLTPVVATVLRLAEPAADADGWIDPMGFRDRLARDLPAEPEQVDRLLRSLIEAGVLEAHPLTRAGLPETGEWAEIRAALRHDPHGEDPEAYRVRLARLKRAMTMMWPQGDTTALLHETAVVTRPVASLNPTAWGRGLSDLDVVRRWLSVFDGKLPIRIVVAEYLRARYGEHARVPFLTFHRHVQEEIAGDAPSGADLRTFVGRSAAIWAPPLAHSRLPRLRELAKLREAARELALGRPEHDGIQRVDPEELIKQMATWPEWIVVPRSCACYVQPAPEGRLVLNVVHGGHGRGLRRLSHLIGRVRGEAVDHPMVADEPEGTVYAELSGSLGSTLNVHVPGTRYEIDYPFSPGDRSRDRRLPLSDLEVVLAPETGLAELRSRRLGFRVIPLHLGMAAEFQLPPAARFLERAFGVTYLLHPSAPPLLRIGEVPPPQEVTRYPRVEVGRVVVQRRRWLAPAGTLPIRAKGEDDASYLLRLVAWTDANGIPTRSFVRAWQERMVQAGQDKARKPLFLDLANPFLVKVFERQIRDCAFVLFEEALPDPADAPPREGSDLPRVIEFLVELGE